MTHKPSHALQVTLAFGGPHVGKQAVITGIIQKRRPGEEKSSRRGARGRNDKGTKTEKGSEVERRAWVGKCSAVCSDEISSEWLKLLHVIGW